MYILIQFYLRKTPQKVISIFKILEGIKGSVIKKKQNLDYYKRIKIEEFLEQLSCANNHMFTHSGENYYDNVNGWEIRYDTNIENNTFFNDTEKYFEYFKENILNELKVNTEEIWTFKNF